MKRRLSPAAFLAVAAFPLFARQLLAQDVLKPFRPDDDTPVMRATPVRPPRTLPSDAVEDGSTPVPVATPIPRTAKATPVPVKRARPVKATPEPQAARPVAPPPAPEPTDPGEIRISPQASTKSPDQVQIDVADSYYARKMYDMAAPEYQRYIELYPGGADMQTALFRLAQCYRQNGAINAAKTTYEMLLERFQTGDFIGPAAYFLAELYYQDKNYTLAVSYYRRASVRLKEPSVINAAKFFTARCDEGVGAKSEARAIYEELAEIKDNNLFRDASRLSFALLLKEGKTTVSTREALKQVQTLLKETDNPELQAEAAVHAGLWELELGQTETAAGDLKKAIDMPAIGRWKEVARFGLIRLAYDTGKYQQVVDSFNEQGTQFSAELRQDLLVLVGDAQRQLRKFADAVATYDQVIKDYPTSPSAKDAAYKRLTCLYNAGDAKLPAEIDAYLANSPDPEKRDEVVLMKAEGLYKKQDFAGAAPIYEAVSRSVHLSGSLRSEALLKFGFCSMQTKNAEQAIKAFSRFTDEYPASKSIPFALIQRALAYQSQKNLAAAEKDFDTIIRKYPTAAKERELALQQKALIRGQQNDNPGMAEAFEQLLKDYPSSTAAAQAHFWIGSAAFDGKDYKKAADHLAKARTMDGEQFFERATLRIMLSNYYLEDKEAVAREVDLYNKSGKTPVPSDVLRWLIEQLDKSSTYESEEKYQEMLTPRGDAQPRDWLLLGNTRLKLSKFAPAGDALSHYLTLVHEPQSRALGLLQLSKAQIGAKDFEAARKSVDEAITLQPEGKINGEAKIVAGDIEMSRGAFDEAAKLYMSVGAILDDEEVTPRALEDAIKAYRKAGKEADAKKTLNRLQSRYPEYFQRNKMDR